MYSFFVLFHFTDNSIFRVQVTDKEKMHFVNRQCVFTGLGIGLVSLGIILAVFWLDIFRSILATVSYF